MRGAPLNWLQSTKGPLFENTPEFPENVCESTLFRFKSIIIGLY